MKKAKPKIIRSRVVTETWISFSFRKRLQLLFGGSAVIKHKVNLSVTHPGLIDDKLEIEGGRSTYKFIRQENLGRTNF